MVKIVGISTTGSGMVDGNTTMVKTIRAPIARVEFSGRDIGFLKRTGANRNMTSDPPNMMI